MCKKEFEVFVDKRPIKAFLGYTIMQTCSRAGIDIPRFCYHDKLLIAGNCRICLIEVMGSKKLVAACAAHVLNNMVIYTNTVRVRLARQNVLEFLLANHPLDCPICDQGGECDLQDITALFGADRGRFYEQEKRAVLNKDFGPLIRTSMNRCIHCTRCVRFLAMSSGITTLGTLGRGSSTEISLYANQFISDELSGNITDLCPVGALTSKPYSFKARPWELTSVASVDVFDSINAPLTFDVMANKICRVLPYVNDSLNECWLTNKARYAYDGLFVQRLNSCLLKVSLSFFLKEWRYEALPTKTKYEVFVKLSWKIAIQIFFKLLFVEKVDSFVVFPGNMLDLESTVAAKLFTNAIGASSFFIGSLYLISPAAGFLADFNFIYSFNTSLVKLSKLPSFCLLLGVNLRFESPLLNLRIAGLVNYYNTSVYKIGGSSLYASYRMTMISNNLLTFYKVCEFKHPFCKNFYLTEFSYRPFIIVGGSVSAQYNANNFNFTVVNFAQRLARINSYRTYTALLYDATSSFGFVHQYSAHLHTLEVGLTLGVMKFDAVSLSFCKLATTASKIKIFYSLGAEINLEATKNRSHTFVVFQGSHGSGVAGKSNLIFPAVTYVEKTGIYRNLLGIAQKANIVVNYGFEARTDVEIFRGLLASVDLQNLKRFFTFSFKRGVLFNFSLLLPLEFFYNSTLIFTCEGFVALAPLNGPIALKKPYSFWRSMYYTISYAWLTRKGVHFFSLSDAVIFKPAQFTKIFTNLLSSSLINYYGDTSSVFLSTSKTMTLCSNIYVKKNLSFSSVYF